MAKPSSPDKRVYDIMLEVNLDGKRLTRTVAVSADATLPEMYRTFQGALDMCYVSEHHIEHKDVQYVGGRGSRTVLRFILNDGDVFVCRDLIKTLPATATVLRAYEVTSRRHYPKVLDGEGASGRRSSFTTQSATWSAQGAARGEYPTREQFDGASRSIPVGDNVAELITSLGGEFSTVAALEGFFVALICGPPVMPSAYLSVLLGENTQFTDLADANRIIGGLMAYHNQIVDHLNNGRVPSLEPKSSVPPSLDDVKAWSSAFCRGMEFAMDGWRPILTHPNIKMALTVIYGFAVDDEENMMSKVLNEDSQQARDVRLIFLKAVLDLYVFCKRHFLDTLMQQAPIRRGSEKVGRNVVCPCGSRKKYKRCCGE